jgi:hypothetical protein
MTTQQKCTLEDFAGLYVPIRKSLPNQGTGAVAKFVDALMINIRNFACHVKRIYDTKLLSEATTLLLSII